MSEDASWDKFSGESSSTRPEEAKGIPLVLDENYPRRWVYHELQNVCEIRSGIAWDKDQEADSPEDGSIPVIKINNVQDGYLDLEEVLHLNEVTESEFEANKARKNWLLVIGSNGSGERVGHCGLIEHDMEFVFASFLYGIKSDPTHILPRFLYYSLNRPEVQKRLTSFTAGSTSLKNLNKSTLTNLVVPTPPLEEQRKIASVLYTVDKVIQKTEEIIDQRERVRTALQQELFRRGIELDGSFRPQPSEAPSLFVERHSRTIPAHWDVEKLGDIGEWVSGKTPSRSEPAFWGGTVPWITAKDMKTLYVMESEDNITKRAIEEGAKVVSSRSVLVLVRGMILDHTLPVVRPMTDSSFNQDVKAILPDESIDPDYLAYWLKAHSNEVLALVTSASHGTKRLATEAFGNLAIPVPPIDEQKSMVERLRTIDELNFKDQAYKARIERLKRALMQDLLSGEVRTHDTDIEIVEDVLAHG